MTRADALKAINEAMADRLKLEFYNLANGYEGATNAKAAARTTFVSGVGIHRDALAFATSVINEKFED